MALDPLKNYDSAGVARELFDNDVTWLYRNKKKLKAEGFPKPISSVGHPRWSGAKLIAWRDRDQPDAALPPDPTGKVVDYSQLLAARAAAVAGGAGARRRER